MVREIGFKIKIMKQHYNYHSFEIKTDKFYFPGTLVFHYHEQMQDDSRNGIKETYLFDGFSIYLLIFEVKIGVKIYETI